MEARLTPRRLLLCATAIVALVSVTSACGGGGDAQAAPKKPPLLTYTDSQLSFTYPAKWKAYPQKESGELHFRPLVYLSTQPIHDPCSTQGNETTCGFPVDHLQPGGVLVTWHLNGIPAMALGAGTRIRVGGRPAAQVTTPNGECRSIGADRTIDVTVETSPLPSALTYFTACLRGPNLAQSEDSVNALLASTKFLAS
ncbi:MAG TPA: hypothetical protein VFU64_04245 [Gaiellaceae bacterium]|nr:hypothetical protein [Gaiellaceae bacterium]